MASLPVSKQPALIGESSIGLMPQTHGLRESRDSSSVLTRFQSDVALTADAVGVDPGAGKVRRKLQVWHEESKPDTRTPRPAFVGRFGEELRIRDELASSEQRLPS